MRGTMGERRGKERLVVPDIGHHREWEPIYIYISDARRSSSPSSGETYSKRHLSLENKPGSMG